MQFQCLAILCVLLPGTLAQDQEIPQQQVHQQVPVQQQQQVHQQVPVQQQQVHQQVPVQQQQQVYQQVPVQEVPVQQQVPQQVPVQHQQVNEQAQAQFQQVPQPVPVQNQQAQVVNQHVEMNQHQDDDVHNFMRDKSHIHDKEHIKLHLDGVIEHDEEAMTEKELQFHYFKQHDYDNNMKLDGLEILQALLHFHHDGAEKAKALTEEELARLVDPILDEDDTDGDGYISYPEFAATQ